MCSCRSILASLPSAKHFAVGYFVNEVILAPRLWARKEILRNVPFKEQSKGARPHGRAPFAARRPQDAGAISAVPAGVVAFVSSSPTTAATRAPISC